MPLPKLRSRCHGPAARMRLMQLTNPWSSLATLGRAFGLVGARPLLPDNQGGCVQCAATKLHPLCAFIVPEPAGVVAATGQLYPLRCGKASFQELALLCAAGWA